MKHDGPLIRKWLRVTRAEKCKACGATDWCSYTLDEPAGAACMRIESNHPMKNGSFFHPFDSAMPLPPPPRARPTPEVTVDCGALMARWRREGGDDRLDAVAKTLGVSEQSLLWLGATWATDRNALAVPMFDATCPFGSRPCGIRLRTDDGAKFAVTGSRSGVFFPYGAQTIIAAHRIFVCEGPSDTAACLDMGIFAIGRASCRGGEDYVLSFLDQLGCDECVVVVDNDSPGQAGAAVLMEKIGIRKTRIVPPGKDLRGFMRDGGSKKALDSLLKNMLWGKNK